MNAVSPYINHFRPVYEIRATIFWFVALVFLPFSGMPYGWAFSLAMLVPLALRGTQVWKALRFRLAISTKWLTTLPVPQLMAVQRKMREESNSMYLAQASSGPRSTARSHTISCACPLPTYRACPSGWGKRDAVAK